MNKKTKNIISIVIILVLVVCLAFTIGDNREANREVVNFNMPTTTRRGNTYRNNRFNMPKRDNEVENKETEKNDEIDTKEDTTEKTDEIKEDSKCKCQEFVTPQVDNWNNQRIVVKRTNDNNSLKTALIVIESFLLGGTVMFLILNNLEKEDNNKTRRVK